MFYYHICLSFYTIAGSIKSISSILFELIIPWRAAIGGIGPDCAGIF
jgi:hypothetical protein